MNRHKTGTGYQVTYFRDRSRAANAYCLKKIDYSESSQIAVLLTDRWGKISVIAKGSKRNKHTALMPIEPLFQYGIIYIDKSPRHLNILTYMEMKRSFLSIAYNKQKYHTVCEILQLCNYMVQEDQPCREVYNQLSHLFIEMESNVLPLTLSKLKYTTLILHLTGFYPSILTCYECRKKVATKKVLFSFKLGSSLCQNCRLAHTNSAIFDLKTLYLIEYLKNGALKPGDRFNKDNLEQADTLLQKHISYVTEKKAMKKR